MLFCVPVGWLTDLYGVGKINLLGNILVAILGFPVFLWLRDGAQDTVMIYLCIGGVMGFMQTFLGSTIYLYVSEMFPTEVRFAATGLSYNLAVGLFGGCAPLYCEFASNYVDLFPGYYLAFCGGLSSATMIYCRWLSSQGLLQASHIRGNPY